MVLPAVLVSTLVGSLNGYVLSKWRFPGSELMFALLLFGVFMPMQVVLLPMSQVLGWLGIASSVWGLILVHVVAGMPQHHAVLPQLLRRPARRAGQGGDARRRRLLADLLAHRAAAVHADHVVTLIWQFTNIWNDFLYGVVFSGADSKPITVGLNNLANTTSSVKEYNVDMAAAMIAGAAHAAGLHAGRQVLRARADGRRRQGMNRTTMSSMGAFSIRKTFAASTEILKGIDISIAAGEFLILVGPSGCGKSTLLNMIAGLDHPSSGRILLGGRDITALPPKDRDIAMVFQSYALYPNMNVAQNIAFGLEMRKVPKAERDAAVQRVAAMLQIEPLAGPQARCSSAAASASVWPWAAPWRATPNCFSFDEPLSNLDAKLRVEMRAEIKLLHQRTHTTTVYVTHDQVEAMTLGDRIAVMKDGVVLQFGTPDGHLHPPGHALRGRVHRLAGDEPLHRQPRRATGRPGAGRHRAARHAEHDRAHGARDLPHRRHRAGPAHRARARQREPARGRRRALAMGRHAVALV
jgi:ABC-type sulfate/molybdate transport systems ATPase subunit